MDTPDSTTPAEQLEGTNVPEFHRAIRAATEELAKRPGKITIYRDKTNRRAFSFCAPGGGTWIGAGTDTPEPHPEKIVTITTGPAWAGFPDHHEAVATAVVQAVGYYWAAVGVYLTSDGKATFNPKRLGGPKGSKLVVTAMPHPAGYSR